MINLGGLPLIEWVDTVRAMRDKEPLQAETILLKGINAGDALSKILHIEYYSDAQGPLYSPEKKMKLQNAGQLQ